MQSSMYKPYLIILELSIQIRRIEYRWYDIFNASKSYNGNNLSKVVVKKINQIYALLPVNMF